MHRQPLILPHEHADATRAAAVAAAAGIEIPVDPQMMEGIETFAPVASMMDQGHAHLAAVAAARAALSEGGLGEVGGGMGGMMGVMGGQEEGSKDRHLMETLTAELKRVNR